MPQLIATVLVVVAAMIYMFNTFGGTGDKISSIAQKPSILAEINNIKLGLKLAINSGDINQNTTLRDLAKQGYFDEGINEQLLKDSTEFNNTLKNTRYRYFSGRQGKIKDKVYENTYSAISFGGKEKPNMLISLVRPKYKRGVNKSIAGLRIQFRGDLYKYHTFLEKEITKDFQSLAYIDRGEVFGQNWLRYEDGKYLFKYIAPTNGKYFNYENKEMITGANDGIFTLFFKDCVVDKK